jgi:hypothetical protein
MVIAHRLLLAVASAVLVALPVSYVSLARNDAPVASPRGLELVVFEADGCIYCEVLRRDVVPIYSGSPESAHAPLRFFNVSREDESKIGLASAITLAPTVVLLRDGREADRLAGYTGPDLILRLVSHAVGETR